MRFCRFALLFVALLPIGGLARTVLYVGNASEKLVSVIDAASAKVTTTIPVGEAPFSMAANSGGSRIYVANAYSDTVSVIDTATNVVVATIPVQYFPAAIAVHPSGSFVYVTNSRSDTVSVISTVSGAVTASIPVAHGPQGIVVDPSGKVVYALGTNDRYISVIDTAKNAVVETIAVGGAQYAVFNPEGTLMLISEAQGITVFDTSLKTVRQSIAATSLGVYHVFQIVVDPSRGVLYAVAWSNDPAGGEIVVLDSVTFAVTKRIPVALPSGDAVLDAAASRLYVTQREGNVAVIDTATLTIIDSIAVAPNPIPIVAVKTSTAPAPVTVVEYHNASLDHYFISWSSNEIRDLDTGVHQGWIRTGQSFKAYIVEEPGTSPICRYYIPPPLGDSHFFGRGADECKATGQKNPSFVLEDSAIMQMYLPSAGICPQGTSEVYRVFSNRPDANHRYMTNRLVRDQMVANGWLAEGDGPNAVVMCAPQ